MAGLRFNLDLFIPEAVYNSIPATRKTAIRHIIRELKSYAVNLNEGQVNEETTTKAVRHLCRHDEGLPCEPGKEI